MPQATVSTTAMITPAIAHAGQTGMWRMRVTVTAGAIPAGAALRFTPMQKAAKLWPVSQFTDPRKLDYTTVETDADAVLKIARPTGGVLKGAQKYAVAARITDGGIPSGKSVTFVFGDTSAGGPGMQMLSTAHTLDLKLSLQIDDDAEWMDLGDAIPFSLEPASAAALKVIGPSQIVPGEDARMCIQVVDAFGNTCRPPEELQIAQATGLHVTPPTFAGLASTSTFHVDDALPADQFALHVRCGNHDARSNPIRITRDPQQAKIYWGDLHAHSNLAQGLETPQFMYEWARDVERLDFIAHVEHDAAGDIDLWVGDEFKQFRPGMTDIRDYIAETWQLRQQLVKKYYEPGRFIPLLGFEWASNIYGHMNVVYRSDDAPIFAPDAFWQADFDPNRLWKLLDEHEAITIPHHTATVGNWRYASGMNWDYYSERFLRVAEIYSKWGSSEYFGCPRATVHQTPAGTCAAALKRGHRFGFVGGSDSHASRPGSDFVECGWDGVQRQAGLTAVYAHDLSRDAIFEAIADRHTYATTGVRMLIDFKVNDVPMGGELTVEDAAQPKQISCDVTPTADLAVIEIVKNGSPIYRYTATAREGDRVTLTVPDHSVTSPDGGFYYLRVLQRDGAMGWASPVWISPRPS